MVNPLGQCKSRLTMDVLPLPAKVARSIFGVVPQSVQYKNPEQGKILRSMVQ